MFLKRLKAQNFRSLEDFDMKFPSRTTVIVGPNNAGKSNIVDVLLFVAQSMKDSLQSALENRGGFQKVVFRHQVQRNIELELTIEDPENGDISYSVAFGALGLLRDDLTKRDFHVKFHGGSYQYTGDTGETGVTVAPERGRLLPLSHPQLRSLRDFLVNLIHVNPFRVVAMQCQIARRPMISDSGSDLATVLHYHYNNDRERFDRYEEVAKSIVPEIEIIETPILGDSQTTVSLRFTGNTEKYDLWQVSSGVKDVLLLLAAIHFSPPGSLVVLEEPENHLHPSSQRALARVICEACARDLKQFIVTTHSDVFLEQFGHEATVWVDKNGASAKAVPLTKVPPYVVGRRLGIDRTRALQLLKRGRQVVVLLEGRDDCEVFEPLWEYFEVDHEVLPVAASGGNWRKLIEDARSLRDALTRFRIGAHVFILLDNDGQRDEKLQCLRENGFGDESSHVWLEKEMECYLLRMPKALASAFAKSVTEVQRAITEASTSVGGKARFERVLERLGSREIPRNIIIRHSITHCAEEIPSELKEVISKVKALLGLQPT